MKRLLLTSSGHFVTDAKLDFFGIQREDLRWAYITTAGKDVPDETYLKIHKKRMRELNYNFKEIDIDNKTEQQVREELEDFDVIYVEGGNTFYLLKAIRACNFEKIIKDKLKDGIIYVGSSAGSIVCCPTIEVSIWKEEIKGPKFSHHGITDFTGMNIVPFLIYVHYDESVKNILKEKMRYVKCNIKILTDNQAIKIENDKIELIGDLK